jgi:pimeloyl-ACP methyl ester carboxylesterase
MADDAIGLLDHLGIPSAHVFGISMGGMIAQELVLRYSARVRRLALGCTHSGISHCVPSPAWVTDIFRNVKGKPREQVVRECIPANFAARTRETNPELVEAVVARMIANKQQEYAYLQQLAAAYQFEAYDRLPEITAPVLVLTGKEDVLIPPGNSLILARRIPGARLVEFEAAGHLFFIEKADEVNQALLDFFCA